MELSPEEVFEEQQKVLNALEEHQAAVRLVVLNAFDRLSCRQEVNCQEGQTHRLEMIKASQPPEPDPNESNDVPIWDGEVVGDLDSTFSERYENIEKASPSAFSVSAPSLQPSATSLGLHRLASSTKRYLDVVAGFLILLNSFVMMVELELEGRAVGLQLGLGDGSSFVLDDIEPIFRGLDEAFVYIFMAELLVRIVVERRLFVKDVANWFDTVLVVIGFVDIWIVVGVSTRRNRDPQNVVMLRLLRVLKCLRAVRMVRTLHLFRGLNLLVKACYCFLPSLCWSMVLLILFMMMGTLIIGNLLQSFIEDVSNPLEDRLWMWNRYGTAYRGMYTLYEVTFAGNWPTNARPVLEKVSHGFVFFFCAYVTLIVFAVIKVISAVFLKDTLEAAHSDAENMILDRLNKKQVYVRKLQHIFHAIEGTTDGMVTEDKLLSILSNPTVVAYFQTLDVDVMDGHALFELLDNGDGEMTMDEFVEGILRCKGPARALDQVAIRSDLGKLDTKLTKLTTRLKEAGVIRSRSKPRAAQDACSAAADHDELPHGKLHQHQD